MALTQEEDRLRRLAIPHQSVDAFTFNGIRPESCECSNNHPYEVTVWWTGAHHICNQCRAAECYRNETCKLGVNQWHK